MCRTKHTLSKDASSARSGGTRRVFTSPLRGAFTITANAYLPERGDTPVGTFTFLPLQCFGGAWSPSDSLRRGQTLGMPAHGARRGNSRWTRRRRRKRELSCGCTPAALPRAAAPTVIEREVGGTIGVTP